MTQQSRLTTSDIRIIDLAKTHSLPQSDASSSAAVTPGLNGINSVCTTAVEQGQPVYCDQVTGQFRLANAGSFASAGVIGLMSRATAAGEIGNAKQLSLLLNDWSAAIGAASLAKGQRYFLATTDGRLTTSPVLSIGNSAVFVGTAISAQLMRLEIGPPILL